MDVVLAVGDVNERKRKVEPHPRARVENRRLFWQPPKVLIFNPPKCPSKYEKSKINSVHYDTAQMVAIAKVDS